MNVLRVLAIAAPLVLAACAAAPKPPPAAAAALPRLDESQERGRAFAVRRCSGCHTVGMDDGGATDGPPFRALARRYNALSLAHRFSEVSAHGFDRMPPVSFTPSESADLVAYLGSLDRP